MGIPPGALEEARQAHEAAQTTKAECKAKAWDAALWIANQRGKPVRAQPYQLESAATQCAELARKAGWLNVHVTEVSRRKSAEPA